MYLFISKHGKLKQEKGFKTGKKTIQQVIVKIKREITQSNNNIQYHKFAFYSFTLLKREQEVYTYVILPLLNLTYSYLE